MCHYSWLISILKWQCSCCALNPDNPGTAFQCWEMSWVHFPICNIKITTKSASLPLCLCDSFSCY
jgi:hypothetical protein